MVYSSYLKKRLTICLGLISCDGLAKILPALVEGFVIFRCWHSWGSAPVCVFVGKEETGRTETPSFSVQEQSKKPKLHPY